MQIHRIDTQRPSPSPIRQMVTRFPMAMDVVKFSSTQLPEVKKLTQGEYGRYLRTISQITMGALTTLLEKARSDLWLQADSDNPDFKPLEQYVKKRNHGAHGPLIQPSTLTAIAAGITLSDVDSQLNDSNQKIHHVTEPLISNKSLKTLIESQIITQQINTPTLGIPSLNKNLKKPLLGQLASVLHHLTVYMDNAIYDKKNNINVDDYAKYLSSSNYLKQIQLFLLTSQNDWTAGLSKKRRLGMLHAITDAQQAVTMGQARDNYWHEHMNKSLEEKIAFIKENGILEDDYFNYLRLISGEHYRMSAVAGALSNPKTTPQQLKFWGEVGTLAGDIPQILNDINDFCALNEQDLARGKSLNDQFADIRKGKFTLPVMVLFQKISEEEIPDLVDAVNTLEHCIEEKNNTDSTIQIRGLDRMEKEAQSTILSLAQKYKILDLPVQLVKTAAARLEYKIRRAVQEKLITPEQGGLLIKMTEINQNNRIISKVRDLGLTNTQPTLNTEERTIIDDFCAFSHEPAYKRAGPLDLVKALIPGFKRPTI